MPCFTIIISFVFCVFLLLNYLYLVVLANHLLPQERGACLKVLPEKGGLKGLLQYLFPDI